MIATSINSDTLFTDLFTQYAIKKDKHPHELAPVIHGNAMYFFDTDAETLAELMPIAATEMYRTKVAVLPLSRQEELKTILYTNKILMA